ncbi:MAG: methionine--tRNA ligase [Alphaproteobacteria bacterium]|nr:methionine--tRNA ligase [Alphaproteobacteria bacterium]
MSGPKNNPPENHLQNGHPQNYYLTTPIYYVNDAPHIGHAYTTLACDVMARFLRLDGVNVKFLTGTDEHGQKVEKAADEAGKAPQDFVDEVSGNFHKLAQAMNFTNDDFIRTTEARHKDSVQALWRVLKEKDEIYLDSYAGWYSVRDEAFYGENELSDGPGGTKLAPSGAEVEWVEEPSYFFRLSKWRQPLLDFYEQNPDFVCPQTRMNEVRSFVEGEGEGSLRDLSVSRTSFKWGVAVPDDPDHVMYVWIDALANYLTAVGYPDTKGAEFETFWPANLHVVGKDILRFHAVYWPAFLMAAGIEPPKRVFAHGWWTNEGEKISKSLGNVIDPFELIEKYGLDPVRYFLLREVPFGKDGDFSRDALTTRMNSELANDFGNLAQRVLSMVHKNCGAQVPQPGAMEEADEALLAEAHGLLGTLYACFREQAFHKALESLWRVIGDANRYMDAQAPWGLKKTDPARMETVLYVLAEVIRHLAILSQPFMPGSMEKMLDQLSVASSARSFAHLGPDYALAAGTALAKPEGVFPRYVEEEEGGEG